MNRKMYRQGDVLLVETAAVPADATQLARDGAGRLVLAHGEATGHAHVFRAPGVCSYSTMTDAEMDLVVVGVGGATLLHQTTDGRQADHNSIVVPPGSYELPVQVEHSPKQAPRIVAD